MGLQDLLAALGVIINGLPQGLLALSYGFAALPTSIAFFIGAAGALAFGLVAPISFQAETITLVGTMGQNREERLSMLIWEGAAMTVIGLMGLLQAIVNFVGPAVTNGMMAGVGVVLTAVAVNMVREEFVVGLTSAATALLVYMPTKNLVYTIVASVAV
ncbi:MAG: NCS2 family permease, partial [Desulfofundulus sp.]